MSMSLKKNNVSPEVMKALLGLPVSNESKEVLKEIAKRMDVESQGFSNLNKALVQGKDAPSTVNAPKFQ